MEENMYKKIRVPTNTQVNGTNGLSYVIPHHLQNICYCYAGYVACPCGISKFPRDMYEENDERDCLQQYQ